MREVEMKTTKKLTTTSELPKRENSTKAARASQAGKPRMGRPPNKEVYAAYVAETKKLMTAIKAGAGKLSNRKIEEGLGIGRDDTGAYSGRYFARYLNADGVKSKSALPPDRLSQIAQKARDLGWLPTEKRTNGIVTPMPFKHLDVPDGELLSERIQLVKGERESLLSAQAKAVAALQHLAATMKACKQMGFMYTVTDTDPEDGELVDIVFDGINVNLKSVIDKIKEAFVFNEEFIGQSLFK
jgi:hypothetical protein